MENASGAGDEWPVTYSSYTSEPQTQSLEADLELNRLSPDVEHLDGEREIEMQIKDAELIRKWKELRRLEKRILHKKRTMARKNVPADFPCTDQRAPPRRLTLRERVNAILQRRHPPSFLSKVSHGRVNQVQSPKEGTKSSDPSKEALLGEEHPLKLRVKALMKQRICDPSLSPANKELPDVTTPPPSQEACAPAKEENGINEGFQRFISILNKGVDMDYLSRIVNDDSEGLSLGEELVKIPSPDVENGADVPFAQSQQSSSGASLLDRSPTNSGERNLVSSRERSLSGLLPDDGDEKNARGDVCSRSRSRSPPAVKKKKKEEVKPKVDEQSQQLQNILNTLGLGLSLGVEEIHQLGSRTQERLYGKKPAAVKADSRPEESGQRGSPRPNRNPSSSSSSSSSSKSSPRRRPTRRDSDQDSRDVKKHVEKEAPEASTYQHSYAQYEAAAQHNPSAFPAFPDSSWSQNYQYNSYYSGSYSAAANPYWTQGANPPGPPYQYPTGNPYPHYTYPSFPPPTTTGHPQSADFSNVNFKLSQRERHALARPRCLQAVSIKPKAGLYEIEKIQLEKEEQIEWRNNRRERARAKRKAKRNRKAIARLIENGVGNSEKPEQDKQPPQKLEAFNQTTKQ